METQIDMWPTDLRLIDNGRGLRVEFDDGTHVELTAELLRVESPSAEVQGHSPEQKKLIKDKEAVCISKMEAVGRYAVRLSFDDGHDTGIYSWQLLHDYGQRHDAMLAAYKARVASDGV